MSSMLFGTARMAHHPVRAEVPDAALVPADWIDHPNLQRTFFARINSPLSHGETVTPELALDIAARHYADTHEQAAYKARLWAKEI
jgi:hypothetical protein